MKKFLTLLMACALTVSLSACGGGNKETTPAVETPPPSSTPANGEAEVQSAEAEAVLAEYQEMLDRYNTTVDLVNADENLTQLDEIINVISEVSTGLDELTDEINAIEIMTDAHVSELRQVIAANTVFIDEMQAMVDNYSGKAIITINATVVNTSGADLYELAISPANDESWGANLLSEPLKDGESGVLSMTLTEDSLVWDIMAADSDGTALEFMGLDFTNVDINAGATITLEPSADGEYTATVE